MPRIRDFDDAFLDAVAAALRGLEPARKPVWGRMTPPQFFAHFATAVRYSLGREQQTPNEGGFFGSRIAGPLILGGWIKIPKNKKAPAMYDAAPPEESVETLIGLLGEFRARLADPAFAPPPHPYFGPIGPAGWARLHIVHLEHHLRQFAAAPPRFVEG